MAMIKCSDCKAKISDSALACPKCGRSLSEEDKAKPKDNTIKTVIAGCLVVLILVVMFMPDSGEESSKSSSSASSTTAAKKTQEMPKEWIAAHSLFAEYEANEVAANKKYKGKLVAVRGVVTEIKSSMMGYPEVYFTVDQYGYKNVVCQFSKKEEDKIAELKRGQTIIAIGKAGVFVIGLNLSIDDCFLYEQPKQ